MADSLFYDNGGVKITKAIFQTSSGTQFQIRNIDAVDLSPRPIERNGPIICIVIGVFMLAIGVGIILIGLGIWWWISQKPIYELIIVSGTNKQPSIVSQNYEYLVEIRSALNAAMAQL